MLYPLHLFLGWIPGKFLQRTGDRSSVGSRTKAHEPFAFLRTQRGNFAGDECLGSGVVDESAGCSL